MTRPLRIDFPGAVYHVTSRGNRRTAIFEDDTDASLFLKVLGEALQRFNAKVLAYCLIDRKSTRLNSSHRNTSRMPSSA